MTDEGRLCMSTRTQSETGLLEQKSGAGTADLDIDSLDNEELMKRYKETGDNDLKWALVLRFQDQIRRVAVQTCGLYSSFSQLDDVIHEGILALLSAVDRFDPSKGVKLETYVAKRLKGMVIDLSRKQDWLPRQLRQNAHRLNRAVDTLSMELGHMPVSQEVADYLGISKEEYEKMLSDTAGANLISFEMLLDSYGSAVGKMTASGDYSDPPEGICEERELRECLAEGISSLRPKERLVLSLYYEKELTMKEIAQVLGVSPPRVSQLHSHAIQRLRVFLKERMGQ